MKPNLSMIDSAQNLTIISLLIHKMKDLNRISSSNLSEPKFENTLSIVAIEVGTWKYTHFIKKKKFVRLFIF